MINSVTNRFVLCIERLLKDNKAKSYRQFALSVDYFPQGLNEILKKKRNVTIDLIQKTCEKYHINANYLFHGKGSIYLRQSKDPSILTVVTDNLGEEKITYVPIAAQAGYMDNINNPIYFSQLKTFSLPGFGFNTGTYRCFDVSGDSMEPIIYNKEQLICSYVDPELWMSNIRQNMVYVFVTTDSIIVKRVQENARDKKHITLSSDNYFYKTFKLKYKEIKEIWSVKLKLSDFKSEVKKVAIIDGIEIQDLEPDNSIQKPTIKNIHKSINNILNQQ